MIKKKKVLRNNLNYFNNNFKRKIKKIILVNKILLYKIILMKMKQGWMIIQEIFLKEDYKE